MVSGLRGPCVETHQVGIFDRGGARRIYNLVDISSVQWERDRDGVSEATIRIEGSACSAQAEALSNIEPKRHEMVIFRGGQRVWEGPVWRVGWHADWVEVNAHDIFEYLLGTPLTQPYSNAHPNVDTVTGRMETILNAELPVWEALDPPANLLPHLDIRHFPNEAETTAVTGAYEMTVGEHFQHLAHYSGVDWTCIGRSFIAWDVSRNLGRIRQLTEADFLGSEIILTAYGSEHAQRAVVTGEDGVYGEATNPDYAAYYGPWTKVFSSFNEEGTTAPTQAELTSQAQRNIAGRSPVPVEVRIPDNSSIRLTDSITIQDLVPGVQIPVLATLNSRRMSQMQKLDHLTVTEDGSGETVQVVLVPATKPDSDDPDNP